MIDLGWFGYISFDMAFLSATLSIILIDLILAGDNAVVIALAVKNLEPKQRKWGIILGAGAAVFLRIVLTFVAAELLRIPFLKFAGGVLIAWIAVKLFAEGSYQEEIRNPASNLKEAIKIICIADLVMSTDNVLAIAGASKGNMFLLIFGLGVSIPFVVGTSTLLAMLMDRYPVIIYIGAAILGKVAGELIITDPIISQGLHPSNYTEYAVQAVFAVGVIIVGRLLMRWKIKREEKGVLVEHD